MGVPGFININTLPGGEPIVYRVKLKPDAPGAPTPTATVPGLGAPTGTPGPSQPTATVPGLGAPTSTPVPFDLSIVVKIDADSGFVMEGWEMNVFQGDGCTGAPILSGPTEFLGYEFGLGYAVFLPPGDYSVSEKQQPGWERVDGTPFCQNFIPGDTPTFFNRLIHDGDLNEDGVTNSLDVLLVLQTIAGLLPEPPNYIRADVNYDGTVNAVDSALMLQFDAGFLDSLPVGSTPTPATPTATPTPTPTATPSPTSLVPLTPPPATATGTATPTPTDDTGNVTIRKVELDSGVVTDSSAGGWSMLVYSGSGCAGSSFIAAPTSGAGLTLGLSPGTYSVAEIQQAGWTALSPACQAFTIFAGQDIEVVFENTLTP